MSTQRDGLVDRIGAFGRQAADGWTRERFVLVSLVVLVLVSFAPRFQVYLFTEFLIIALFAVAFNLLYGYTGLLSFGHAMFFGAGAYGLAIVMRDYQAAIGDAVGSGLAPLATFVVGGLAGLLLALVLAVPVGYLSVRLEEIYFALITLAFGMLFYSLLIQDPYGLTDGTDGIFILLGTVELGGAEFRLGERRTYYYLTAAVVVASIYAIWRIVNSPFGTVCKAIRESPDRATALGVNVTVHRWMTFVVSALFVGVAGVLIAGFASVATPNEAHWTMSATPVVATVIGGATYFGGPIVGAFVYHYVRWLISRFPALEAYWELFFGIMLIVVVLYFKRGAAGGLVMLGAWLRDVRAAYDRGGASAAAAFVRESIGEKVTAAANGLAPTGGSDDGGVDR
ncbi:branched-chain amino acid ABC transporter permease [Natrinema salifodinae]|uniref:Amino acid/amide ABC transporter membrane protein 2, HAAT family n=1 Tax=Natrinema salifodinae TaxID=1202768 RepID=A0A1I0N7L2_9EURY|nr:branched-chain amino acid ABC transporter permease [Natrinema salifodinae]SEV97126.1 amino acid/amide ABC transporter membrane protein 2, HAAT family [Natrinema salifodinae]